MTNKKDETPIDAEVVDPGTEVKAAEQNALQSTNPHDKLIELALNQNADVDKLERLFALKERFEANEAKKAYVVAMSDFRKKCPQITRTSSVSYKQVSYKFAPLSEIIEQIKSVMSECGLSHSWSTNQGEKGLIEVTCKVTHILGHSEETTLMAQKDDSGSKNSIQAIGSSVSYLQRYTLKSLLGLAEGDDDGKAAEEDAIEHLTEAQITELDGIINENDIDKAAFLKFFKIESLSDIQAEHFESAKRTLLKSVTE